MHIGKMGLISHKCVSGIILSFFFNYVVHVGGRGAGWVLGGAGGCRGMRRGPGGAGGVGCVGCVCGGARGVRGCRG